MQTVLITGGTGLIGSALTKSLLNKGYKIIILSRQKRDSDSDKRVQYALWDVNLQTIESKAIAESDHIIHLAGAGVSERRWSKKRKREIVDSRVKSGELLVRALRQIPNRIQSIVSASAIGWYGPDPLVPNPRPFRETDPAAEDFLGQTCVQWERSLEPAKSLGKRVVFLRTGIVLSANAGALKEFIKPLKVGAATILGSGRQIVSWVHIEDLVRLYINAIENQSLMGTYNAVAPQPVSNKELVLHLARSRQNFYVPIHVPAFILKLVIGEMSVEVLKSTTVSAEKILSTGYNFKYSEIVSALDNI
jgi:uncharacterized protein